MSKIVSKKIRDSARGESCTLRLSCCTFNPEQTVACHAPVPGQKGIGMKVPDIFVIYGCTACHDAIDGRNRKVEWDYKDILRAMGETIMRLIDKGLVIIK